jgi:hypothetical protein
MVPYESISSVDFEKSGHSGNQVHYRVKLSLVSGDRATVAGGIPGRQPTEWLVCQLRNRLGLPEAPDEEIPETDVEL